MRDTFSRTLHQMAKQDPKVFIVVADISPAGSMEPFREEFPDHFINVGVSEQNMIGICAGLAMRGCTAFAYTIATFTVYRPFEQIRVDLCYQNLPVTLVGIGGGVSYSLLGGTHHAQEDIAVMSALPNMTIIAPCDPLETEAATWASGRSQGPVYLRLGKAGEPDLTSTAVEPFQLGKLRTLKDGSDICIISYGPIMSMVLEVAERIKHEQGASVSVISAHTLKPLDVEGIAGIMQRFDDVVVIEEHSQRGGLAAQMKEIAWDSQARCKLHTFSLQDEFIHVWGSQAELWRAHGISIDLICNSILANKPINY
jgi:transketolase